VLVQRVLVGLVVVEMEVILVLKQVKTEQQIVVVVVEVLVEMEDVQVALVDQV
jgi:hypothetical protein